jgi:hypothetical protein
LELATVLRVRETTGTQLDRQAHAAQRWLRLVSDDGPTGRMARWLAPMRRRGPGTRQLVAAVEATRDLPASERDALLLSLLEAALPRPGTPQPADHEVPQAG